MLDPALAREIAARSKPRFIQILSLVGARYFVSNRLYDEPDARTVSRESPPATILRLIPGLREAGYNTLDGVNCISACWIRVGYDFPVDYLLIRIEGKFNDLKSHFQHQSQPSAFALA